MGICMRYDISRPMSLCPGGGVTPWVGTPWVRTPLGRFGRSTCVPPTDVRHIPDRLNHLTRHYAGGPHTRHVCLKHKTPPLTSSCLADSLSNIPVTEHGKIPARHKQLPTLVNMYFFFHYFLCVCACKK